jgi:hypothetical protein
MRLNFSEKDWERKHALAVSFDLCGFSKFCTHPEAHANLAKLVSSMFTVLSSFFDDSIMVGFFDLSTKSAVAEPDFIKYSGDGALMLWFLNENREKRRQACTAVVSAMRLFQKRLDTELASWRDDWGVSDLPTKSRIGIAMGHITELKPAGDLVIKFGPVDYAGYCINFAVRLQDNPLGIPFVVHKPVAPQIELVPYKLSGMKGVLEEEILIFPEHQNLLNPQDETPELKRKATLKVPMEAEVKRVFEKSPREGVRRAYAYFLEAVSSLGAVYSYEFSDNYAERIAGLIKTGMLSIREKDRLGRIEEAFQLAGNHPDFPMAKDDAWRVCNDIFIITRVLNQKIEEMAD